MKKTYISPAARTVQVGMGTLLAGSDFKFSKFGEGSGTVSDDTENFTLSGKDSGFDWGE